MSRRAPIGSRRVLGASSEKCIRPSQATLTPPVGGKSDWRRGRIGQRPDDGTGEATEGGYSRWCYISEINRLGSLVLLVLISQ